MDRKDEGKIIIKAIGEFGSGYQIGVAQEECAELISALSKYRRSTGNRKMSQRDRKRIERNVAEEMADVQIMIDELNIIMDNYIEMSQIKHGKLLRLEKRIAAHKKNVPMKEMK